MTYCDKRSIDIFTIGKWDNGMIIWKDSIQTYWNKV